MSSPLADRIRPQTLDDMVGQEHILGKDGLLRRVAQGGNIPNMIFYGPSGVGKTTAARIIASGAGKKLYKLNGTTASTGDIKALIGELNTFAGIGGVVLYLDEIQYLNKKQQQTLLEFIEDGSITLIASTTENPYFYIYNAILSRSTVFEFKPVSAAEIERSLVRVLGIMGEENPVETEEGVLTHIASCSGGDVRKAMNALELCWLAAAANEGEKKITLADAKTVAQRSAMRYDRDGDEHYDLLSALQKSIRGSDENAALHYLARLLAAGDLLSPCRRLLVIAAEDIGLAYPMAMPIVKACVDAAVQLGLPEARIPLAEATVFLATQPKSNSAYMGIAAAMEDIQAGKGGSFPRAVQNKHYDSAEVEKKGQDYKYPHDFPDHYVVQQYLPDDLADAKYYSYGENKLEQATENYWGKIKK
ncbi:MAG: replication-associated recombination protein A [Angelakisella sp.]